MLSGGDGEADLRLAADGDHGVGVEAAVGPHGELAGGSGIAHSADGFPQEVGRASSGVGPTLPQAGHQHVASSGGDGEERVIAPLSGVVVALRALLPQSVGLADGGVQVDSQRIIARTGASRPGSGQRLPDHPIQLAHVPPPETPQEGTQCGRRLYRAAQHLLGTASAQRVGVVNAIATSQCRRHQRQHLVPRVGSARDTTQVNMAIHQLAQSQMMGQRDRKQQ